MKFEQFPKAVVKENVDYTVKEITNVIKKYGPRESGNDACFNAEKHLKKELDQFCDETHFEEYQFSPRAFLHFTKTVGASIIVAVVLGLILALTGVVDFFVSQCIVGVVVGIGLFITAMEFLFYKQFTDKLHKHVTGHNLVATRKPRGEVKRRIVISGHIDAAYEWRPIYVFKEKGMALVMPGIIGSAIISFVISIVSVVLYFVDMASFAEFISYSYYFHILTAIFMVELVFFANFKRISPGANDNLTGTYSAVCALRMLDMAGIDFENTEVVAMINDGEESGLRGAKAYAKAHRDEYTNDDVETAVLCVDTLTDLEYLNVYSKDMTGTVQNDKAFSNLVLNSAKEVGYKDAKLAKVYFGSSDAAAFTQEKITSTCLAAMDPAPADYYHNRRDSYDRLRPEAIEAGYEVILASIFNFDENGAK